jgi:hypothetical protein
VPEVWGRSRRKVKLRDVLNCAAGVGINAEVDDLKLTH